jgi:hypothetical protein
MTNCHAICAVIAGADQCEAIGHKVHASVPVLALCRKLIEAGHDPGRPLDVYRGDVLALRVRSIGEVARLSIRGDGVGFRRGAEMVGASLVRYSEEAGSFASLRVAEEWSGRSLSLRVSFAPDGESPLIHVCYTQAGPETS